MEQTPTSSRRMLVIGIVAVVALIAVIAIVAVLLFGTTTQQETTTPPTSAAAGTSGSIATKEEVKENLSDLDTTIKQAAKDQAAVKAAQKDGDNQIKVEL